MFPVYLNIFGFELHTYGLMVASGFALGIYIAFERTKRLGLNSEITLDTGLVLLVSAMAGGRLLYVLLDVKYYISNPGEIIFQRGGFVFYGGVIFSIIIAWVYLKKKGVSFLEYADLFAPSIAIGHSLGRWGCLFQGCCFGKITHSFLGVKFPLIIKNHFVIGSPAAIHHLNLNLIDSNSNGSLPIHPVQIYESIGELIIFFILIYLSRRKHFKGLVFSGYIILYGILRFGDESFRGDDRGSYLFGLSPAQWISALSIFAILSSYFLYFKKQPR